jgi:mitogen-activated protein kinase kinase kinase
VGVQLIDCLLSQVGQHNKRPPVPDDVVLSATANDFMNEKCLAIEPNDRPTAEELKRHPFITDFDPRWTFADSNLGRLVNAGTAKRR